MQYIPFYRFMCVVTIKLGFRCTLFQTCLQYILQQIQNVDDKTLRTIYIVYDTGNIVRDVWKSVRTLFRR